jgi:hypothetical protein
VIIMKTIVLALMIGAGTSVSLAAQGAVSPTPNELSLARRIAGCYELESGAWQTDSAMAKIVDLHSVPIRFELIASTGRGWAKLSAYERITYFAARTDSASAATWGDLFTTWTSAGGGSPRVFISRPLSMAGIALDVAPHGDDLAGSIIASTDAIPPDGKSRATHTITARRVVCRR